MDIHSRCSSPIPNGSDFRENIEANSPEKAGQRRGVKRVATSLSEKENTPEKPAKYEGVNNFAASSSSSYLDNSERSPLKNITYSPNKSPQPSGQSSSAIVSKVRPFSLAPLDLFSDRQDVEKSILTQTDLDQLGIEEVNPHDDHDALLARQGFEKSSLLGSGQFGSVYALTHKGVSTVLIYKIQNIQKAKKLEKKTGENFLKLWRRSDFAPARLQERLPHLAKIISYTIIATTPQGAMQRFQVPVEKIREFAQKLPEATEVKIEGMLMERAPGKSLADLVKDGSILANLEDSHFRNILVEVHEFVLGAYEHNFIHGDLKPENIMYDMASGKVTIIDTGESLRLRSREKSDEQVRGPSNPTMTKKIEGTRRFIAPVIFQGKAYGSEIDFFSTGMTMLSLISKNDADVFAQQRLAEPQLGDHLFSGKQPAEFLETYLTTVASSSKDGSPRLTAANLLAQPTLQRIIDLDFQISGGGNVSEVALVELRQIVAQLKAAV